MCQLVIISGSRELESSGRGGVLGDISCVVGSRKHKPGLLYLLAAIAVPLTLIAKQTLVVGQAQITEKSNGRSNFNSALSQKQVQLQFQLHCQAIRADESRTA